MPGLLGKKIGMTSVFSADGKNVPCTVIEAGPCVVTQVKTVEKDGYEAVQLGFQDKKEKHTTKPLMGHFKKAGVTPKKHLAEFKEFETELNLGDTVTVELFNDATFVDVVGTSKGKGFQGVVKRHGFGGVGQTTHGQHNRARKPGSIGACSYPAKVFKGMRMGGQLGGDRVTVQNLQVLKVIAEHNLLLMFGNSLYKAESYGLIYWSHGEGWIPTPLPSTRWIGNDKTGGGHYMNIEDLKSVLQNAPHFDFIMFDACFMQSVEVAYELRDCCDYYIGFPAENPGPGAAYDRMFPFIFQKGAAVEMAIGTFAAYDEIYTGKIGSNSNWTMGTAIDVLKSSELENLAAATANALSGVTADREVLRSSVFDYDQRKVGSSYYVGYYDFVEMMEKLVVDEVVLDEWKQAYDAASVCWKKTPMIYSMSVGMFSMKRANGVSHYIPSTATSAAAQAANAAYRSTSWYSAVGLARLGW